MIASFIRRIVWFNGINVILTYRCNLGCPYCYGKGVTLSPQDMAASEFEEILRWLRRNRHDKLSLSEENRHNTPSLKSCLRFAKKME